MFIQEELDNYNLAQASYSKATEKPREQRRTLQKKEASWEGWYRKKKKSIRVNCKLLWKSEAFQNVSGETSGGSQLPTSLRPVCPEWKWKFYRDWGWKWDFFTRVKGGKGALIQFC